MLETASGGNTSPDEVPDHVMAAPEFAVHVLVPLSRTPVEVAQEAVFVAQFEVTFELGMLVATVRTVSRVAMRSPAKNT